MNITSTKTLITEGKEKEAINFILQNCFKSGFGTLSKTELDLILFAAILKYSAKINTTDHALSKYLQITQQRIRNLKEKSSVKYMPITREDAIRRFADKAVSAKMEDIYLDIPINDIAVKNEIEAILDENNILLHSQLNPKIFRIRIDDFLELSILFELEENPGSKPEEIEKRILAEITKKAEQDINIKNLLIPGDASITDLTKSTLKDALIKGGVSFGVDLLASLIPGGAFLSGPVKKLLTTVQNKI